MHVSLQLRGIIACATATSDLPVGGNCVFVDKAFIDFLFSREYRRVEVLTILGGVTPNYIIAGRSLQAVDRHFPERFDRYYTVLFE